MFTFYDASYRYYFDKRYGNYNEELSIIYKLSRDIIFKELKSLEEEYNMEVL
jgi:hypothetical protein